MTNKKLGSVLFVEDGVAIGLLSDGDLRRALFDKNFSLDKKAYEFATKNPLSIISNELLAVEALEIIEKNKIQLLILTDENKKLIGVVHIHDLVEAGIS